MQNFIVIESRERKRMLSIEKYHKVDCVKCWTFRRGLRIYHGWGHR